MVTVQLNVEMEFGNSTLELKYKHRAEVSGLELGGGVAKCYPALLTWKCFDGNDRMEIFKFVMMEIDDLMGYHSIKLGSKSVDRMELQ